MYFGKRLSGLTEVFNNQNFNRLQSSLSLSILASFCICCYSYLPRAYFNVLSSYFYVSFNLVAVFSVWPSIFALYKRNWQTRLNCFEQLFLCFIQFGGRFLRLTFDFRSLQTELANKVKFYLSPEVLPSVHAPSANFTNQKSFTSPEPLGLICNGRVAIHTHCL